VLREFSIVFLNGAAAGETSIYKNHVL